jgi:hypothetical protein
MKSDLRSSYPYGPAMLAETANAYAALIFETARVADELIGSVIRTGDAVLGVLSPREIKDSYSIVRDSMHDNWASLFTAFADRECDDGVMSVEDWTKRIVDTLRAVRTRRVPVAA